MKKKHPKKEEMYYIQRCSVLCNDVSKKKWEER